MYFLPLARTYKTKLNYNIDVPMFSKIKEKVDSIESNDDNTKITITSYQSSNSTNIIDNFIKEFTKYDEDNGIIYYYNSKEDYSIKIDNIKNGITQIIELSVIKGNKHERIIEDETFYEKYRFDVNNARVEEDNSGLVNVYENIYKYNLGVIQISYIPDGYDHNYLYTLKDIFQYKYYKIEDFLNYYDKIVVINYGKKIEGENYILYTPEKRMYSGINYSILICNNKYIFGSRNLKYSKELCN